MAKAITKDGKVYRVRRGKLVEVPAEWVGKVPGQETIAARASKQPPKVRKVMKHGERPPSRRTEREVAVAQSIEVE